MRVVVDVSKCVSAGQCVRAAPTVFGQDENDGMVVLLQENPDSSLTEAVHNAARWCPTSAILIEESDTHSAEPVHKS